MTVQHDSYRQILADQPARNHAADYSQALKQLRAALYANDAQRVARIERRIDEIVEAWEADRHEPPG